MSKNHLGAVYMILSVLFFSFMDILIKITDEYDVGQTMFFRALFGLIPIYFLIPKEKIRDFIKRSILLCIFIDLFLEQLQWHQFL